ncbi:MAG: YncE family protein, partial [Longimicrobiales bacterium]
MTGNSLATTHKESGKTCAHRQRRIPVAAAAWVALVAVFAMGACDGDNLFRPGNGGLPGQDSTPPQVEILAPGEDATFPLGDSILVRARIFDLTGIKTVRMHGESIRQDSASDTQIVERFDERSVTFPQPPATDLPTDTTLLRFLVALPDTVSETVQIIVEAEDSLGNVATGVVEIGVGGPRVEIRTPATGSQVQVGGTLVVQAFAVDRSNGIDSMKVFVTGAQTQEFIWRGLASPDSVRRDTSFVVGSTIGALNIEAAAWSSIGNEGSTAQPVTVNVVNTSVTDTEPPRVALALSPASRVELDDSIEVTVTAEDAGSAGLRRIGVVMIALPDTSTLTPDTLVIDSIFAASRTGQLDRTFHIRLADFPYEETDQARLPRRFTLQVHAFAVDTVGNASANTTTSLTAGPALRIPVGATLIRPDTAGYVMEGTTGLQQVVTGVLGTSVALPTGGNIAHAVVDRPNERLYLSNLPQNRVEVLDLATSTFASPVPVGSEPWGMFMNNGGDTLIVANSGGTNVSFVDLSTMQEHTQRRLLTPNAVLFEVASSLTAGLIRYEATFYDFSDRPQFIAQDNTGVLLYSTKPTGTAQEGTVRWVDPVGTTPEVRILFNQRAIEEAENTFAIAHIDSLSILPQATQHYLIKLYDHVPGSPAVIIESPYSSIEDAITFLEISGSDIAVGAGRWIPENVGLSDTTYIAASVNREYIAFGEGGV